MTPPIWMLPCLALLPGLLWACPIPVYQYALEHWSSDPYELTLKMGHAPAGEQKDALAILQRAADGDPPPANVRLTIEHLEGDAARLEVRYPAIARSRQTVWDGDLSVEAAKLLLSSPARTRVGEALARRTTAVWLLLESGNRQTDGDAEALLRRELARLEKELIIPETAEWGGQEVKIDHNVNFQVIRIRRDDPAERMFVRMLLASEADLETEFKDQPIVFPIYGRGLILYALVGRGINASTIGEAIAFLTGPCSCQIKAGNPGTDLLMDTDWTAKVAATTPASVGETVGAGSFLRRMDDAEADAQ